VILSAVAGKAALRVFQKEGLEFITTRFNIDEVREYLSVIGKKYNIEEKILELQLQMLPLKIYDRQFYEDFIEKASEELRENDIDDIELLALAMKLQIPVWSNDSDFQHLAIDAYPTAVLLKALDL
jgi:predicted nucleic acid-binding protein